MSELRAPKRPDSVPWDKLAKHYFEEIISPLTHSEKNPLFECLRSLKNKKDLVVGDLGCGTGPLLPHLRSFKKVWALDFSEQMLEQARQRVEKHCPRNKSKFEFLQLSLTDLDRLQDQLDVAVAVNSFLMTEPTDVANAFKGLGMALRSKGKFFGIFPALESIQEEYQFTYERELKKLRSHDAAINSTTKKMEGRRINFALGLYHTGDMVQKYYTRVELENHLSPLLSPSLLFDRVVYKREFSYNYGDQDLRGHPRMWDWFVYGERV